MTDIALVGAPLLYIGWGCRRCGHTGGMARTTVPIALTSPEIRLLMESQLRSKLVRVHQAKQGCVALPDDFVFHPVNPHGDRA